MLKRSLLTLTLAVLLVAGFGYGVVRLFTLRYEAGEVYPPYSTMRADPLGAKGLFEALDELPGVEVRRNFQPLKKLQPGHPITLVYLGVQHQAYWTERELQEFESLLAGGTRAVFAFFPFDRPPIPEDLKRESRQERERKRKQMEREERKSNDAGGKEEDKKGGDEETRSGLVSFADVAKRFGFQFGFLPAGENRTYDRHAFVFEPGAKLERDLSWHSAIYFHDLTTEWKALYLSETKPVIVERRYGRGSIVLSGDAFFFSNEALRKERHTRLLARIFDGPADVVFDEEHLGVTNQPGIVQLALKYRLHGVIAGLLLIAVLFVWKNAVRFIPAHSDAHPGGDVIAGRDSTAGFNNLLFRAIKPGEIFDVCVEEWRKIPGHQRDVQARVEGIRERQAARPPKQRNPVAAWREIAEVLARKSGS